LTGALYVLHLQPSSHHQSSLAPNIIQRGGILAPANPGSIREMAITTERERKRKTERKKERKREREKERERRERERDFCFLALAVSRMVAFWYQLSQGVQENECCCCIYYLENEQFYKHVHRNQIMFDMSTTCRYILMLLVFQKLLCRSQSSPSTHTHSVLTAIFQREPGLAGCPLNSPPPFIPGLPNAHPFGTGLNFPCHF